MTRLLLRRAGGPVWPPPRKREKSMRACRRGARLDDYDYD
jgi:hypothetical protein